MKPQILLLNAKHEWTPPVELRRARPRRVVLTMRGTILVLVSALLLAGGIAAGILLGMSVGRGQRDANLLERQAEIADAIVTRVWRDRTKERQPRISYRFDVRGLTYARDIRVPLRFWNQLEAGSHIPVQYAASRPDLNHPLALKFSRTPVWVPFVVPFWIAIWSPVVLLLIRLQKRLLAEGRAALAIVTRHGSMQRGPHGNKLGMKYYYDFKLLSGAPASGSAGPVKEPPDVGARITVLYDPDKPRRNAPYPFSSPLFRISP